MKLEGYEVLVAGEIYSHFRSMSYKTKLAMGELITRAFSVFISIYFQFLKGNKIVVFDKDDKKIKEVDFKKLFE